MREFLDMGGYAAFVWPAYAVTLAVIVLNIYWARRQLAQARAAARRRLAAPQEAPMTPRRRRLVLVLGILAGVSIAGALALNAFKRNVTFFFDPTAVAAARWPRANPSVWAAW